MSNNIYLDQLPPLQRGYDNEEGPAPLSVVRVGASINTKAQHHVLSTIDQISPAAYVGCYLCFKTELNADKHEVFNQLSIGLQHALAEFPHMTGKIVQVQQPSQGRAIELDNFGVLVSMLDWTAPEYQEKWAFSSFAEILDAHFPMAHMPSSLLLPREGLANLAKIGPDRCMYVQVNFIAGGLILAVSYNHACSDGPGFSTFAKTWAGYTAEASKGLASSPSAAPISFDGPRTIMSTGTDGVNLKDFPFWKPAVQETALDMPAAAVSGEVPQHSIWSISYAKLSQLQKDLKAETQVPLSKNDAVCALLWRHCAIARGLHEETDKHTHSTLSCTVNTRSSMGLPDRYIGNACEPNANTKLPIKALCAPGNASLAQTATAIRSVIKSVDAVAVRRLIGMLHTLPSPKSVTWNVDRWPGPDMLITNMFNGGRCEYSWGTLLNRAYTHRTVVSDDDPVDGRCYIFSKPSYSDNLEFLLNYPSRVVERLRRDQEFSRYVDYLG